MGGDSQKKKNNCYNKKQTHPQNNTKNKNSKTTTTKHHPKQKQTHTKKTNKNKKCEKGESIFFHSSAILNFAAFFHLLLRTFFKRFVHFATTYGGRLTTTIHCC